MKALFLVLIFLVQAAGAEPTLQFETIVRYQEEVGGHSNKVVLHQRSYDFSKHKITGGEGRGGPAKIDGKEIAGTDGTCPRQDEEWPYLNTLVSISLEWDGKKVSVPPPLHLNLLNLTLAEGHIQFVPRPSGEEILIQATGGDGGAHYGVSLVLRKNGNHKQYLYCFDEELPTHPYEITEYLGVTDSKGRPIVKYYNWLSPGDKQTRYNQNPLLGE